MNSHYLMRGELLNEGKIKKKTQMDMYAKWFEALVDLLVLIDMGLVTS